MPSHVSVRFLPLNRNAIIAYQLVSASWDSSPCPLSSERNPLYCHKHAPLPRADNVTLKAP